MTNNESRCILTYITDNTIMVFNINKLGTNHTAVAFFEAHASI